MAIPLRTPNIHLVVIFLYSILVFRLIDLFLFVLEFENRVLMKGRGFSELTNIEITAKIKNNMEP